MATDFTTGTVSTSTGTVVRPVTLNRTGVVSISGTYGTHSFVHEGSTDGGVNYFALKALSKADGTLVTSTVSPSDNTKNGWDVDFTGLTHYRYRATALATGSVSVVVEETDAGFFGVSGTVMTLLSAVTQGTPATLANAWSTKLTDATNGPVAVKAASTAVAATDKALVVGVSTNTPITLGDGTNGPVAVKAASTGAAATDKALVVRPMLPTDGTNTQPAGDAAARSVFVEPNDGTNVFKSGSAANLAATNAATNAQLITRVADWVVTHAPAASNQASASKAAGVGGVRHVCTSVSFNLTQTSTGGTPFTGVVNLRDGATGAGSVLATWSIAVPTAACSNSNFSLSSLNIIGTADTAMTLEFTAGGGAQTVESCTITGYDVI